ncbi:hypothetical protein ONS95_006883 [Cadophora gregata]|uniref:uncharacterized protein n=1 Tax=Cadophora gregata TaxID=51156 RepID=UPI0026DD241B|nr:uncharacterized protein ONS95_006883 [Cadophora gregata]KAK0101728.1 hypothetical protein ONS95_006883 [Cadophora gregata]
MNSPRADDVVYISPVKEVNAGLWTLFTGATVFLGLRLYCKLSRRTGLWYDDYVLILSWLVLLANDIIIDIEWSTGYVKGDWDDRMHILINISSCGTLIGQALSKTALGITLLRMSNKKQSAILWYCIISMNVYMIIKCFFQWAKFCGKNDYQNWYNIQGPCLNYDIVQDFEVGGNTYNIVMDFVFAAFPWWITWSLEMRKVEKIALCLTMSLGMFVAIMSAVRTWWKDRPIMHVHDEYYIWRNGMSNIWYSAEVAGTIIVQCIPILRPFLRDIKTSMSSKRDQINSVARQSRVISTPNAEFKSKHHFDLEDQDSKYKTSFQTASDKHTTEVFALDIIPEEPGERRRGSLNSQSPSETGRLTPMLPSGPLFADQSWRFSVMTGSDRTEMLSPLPNTSWIDLEQQKGLSPAPPRPTPP